MAERAKKIAVAAYITPAQREALAAIPGFGNQPMDLEETPPEAAGLHDDELSGQAEEPVEEQASGFYSDCFCSGAAKPRDHRPSA